MWQIKLLSTTDSGRNSGFTLLELLVAMLMMSMVTIIISLALKLGINTWERVQGEGDTFQARIVIPSLLRKQLDSVIMEKVFAPGEAPQKLAFKGNEKGLSFFTSYAPMGGSSLTGLLRVTYVYDRENQILFLYQQLILTREDLQDTNCPLSEEWDKQLMPSGKIAQIFRFDIRYSTQKSSVDTELVKNIWEDKNNPYPKSIFLDFQTAGSRGTSDIEVWHFNFGTG